VGVVPAALIAQPILGMNFAVFAMEPEFLVSKNGGASALGGLVTFLEGKSPLAPMT
jgi:hypothetical protein